MPSLHAVGAAEGCSFHMHFHLGTNPHQRLPGIIGEPFLVMVGGVCKVVPTAGSHAVSSGERRLGHTNTSQVLRLINIKIYWFKSYSRPLV